MSVTLYDRAHRAAFLAACRIHPALRQQGTHSRDRAAVELLEQRCMLSASYPDALNLTLTCGRYGVAQTAAGATIEPDSNGWSTNLPSGSPMLPAKLLRIALPPTADLSSVRLSVANRTLVSAAGRLDLEPVPVPTTTAENRDADLGWRNPAAYAGNSYLNSQPVVFIDAQQMGQWKLAEIWYSPFSYNPATDSLKVTQSADIRLDYRLSQAIDPATQASGPDAAMVYNYDAAAAWYNSAPQGTVTDLAIITTSAIQSGSTKLASYVADKRSHGLNVAVVTESQWGGGTGDTAADNIRRWLQGNYVSLGIRNVLLVGNPDPSGDVPMKMCWPRHGAGEYEESPSDYYYADLTSNWDADADGYFGEWGAGQDFTSVPLPEVVVGRIPVYGANYADLDKILAKDIAYANASDISWRKSILLPMAICNYANEDSTGWPVTDGVSLAEGIRSDLAVPNGYSTWRMYEQEGVAPVTAPCDQPVSEANLIGRWSSNPYGVVDWWGHGNSQGAYRKYWSSDSNGDGVPQANEMTWAAMIQSSDTTSLNDSRPSFVTQVSCENGWPEDSSNLGYSLLRNGAIATVSASRVSWYAVGTWDSSLGTGYGDNASYAYYITEHLVENGQVESFGAALSWCRANLGSGFGGESWMNVLDSNLYGDPTLSLGAHGAATGGKLSGAAWYDTDGDGARDTGETPLSGWTAYLDQNGNGVLDQATTGLTSSDVPKAINDNATSTSNLTVTGVAGLLSDVNVKLNITHTYDADLTVYLIGPSGQRVQLFHAVGSSGDNFIDTTLDDEAAIAIKAGSAPFTGSFRPAELLSTLDGTDPNGLWTLEVSDGGLYDIGTLNSWSLTLTTPEISATTDSSGNYVFTNVAAGAYTVREVLPTGWSRTWPASGYYTGTLLTGGNITGLDFGARSLPDLQISALAAGSGSVGAGTLLSVNRTYVVSNRAATSDFALQYRLSTNSIWGDADDIVLTPDELINTAEGKGTDSPHSGSFSALVPAGVAPGTYYVLARIDNGNTVTESDETNNVALGGQVTVTDGTAPKVSAVQINDGNVQRSMVKKLTVTFSEPVTLGTGALKVLKSTGAVVPNLTVVQANPSGDKRTWELTFSGSAVIGGSLPDGMYKLAISAAGVADLAGNHLAADYALRFHRLFGDADGDRDVDKVDLAAFTLRLNRPAVYVWWLDYTANGIINNADYLQFRARLTKPLLA